MHRVMMTPVLCLLTTFAFAEVYISKEEAIKNIFPVSQRQEAKTYQLDGQALEVFTVFNEGEMIGLAVVLDEMGKIKPITFLVGIDKGGKVLDVYLLEYRDMFGAEIRRRSFLRQFRGRSSKSPLKIGHDIDAVTSATISSRAAAAAVRKSLKVIRDIAK